MRALIVIAPFVLGCGVAYQYTQTSQTVQSPKASTCDFQVVATVPADGVEELGVLDMRQSYGGGAPTSMGAFKETVRTDVCKAGGDLVVGQVNGFGIYMRGVVFRKVNKQPEVQHGNG